VQDDRVPQWRWSGLANAHPKVQSENKKLAIRSISVEMRPLPPTFIWGALSHGRRLSAPGRTVSSIFSGILMLPCDLGVSWHRIPTPHLRDQELATVSASHHWFARKLRPDATANLSKLAAVGHVSSVSLRQTLDQSGSTKSTAPTTKFDYE